MRLFFLLLGMCWVIIVTSGREISPNTQLRDVTFPVDILQPDLDAIEKYHKTKDSHFDAFIHWPNDIVFLVQRKKMNNEDEAYLKIHGNFQTKIIYEYLTDATYDSLYYKNGIFYGGETGPMNRMFGFPDNLMSFYHKQELSSIDEQKLTMKPLSPFTVVNYEQKPITQEESYLSIRYKSIEEVEKVIKPFHMDNQFYLKFYSEASNTTYLATWGEPTEYFLEYQSTWRYRRNTGATELRTLIGQIKYNHVTVDRNEISAGLVFNQKKKTVTLPVNSNSVSPPFIENVFGVRMESIGFMEEVRKDKVKLLSADDLDIGGDLSEHAVYMQDFLSKAKTVEPKSCFINDEVCELFRPKMGKFQVHGHVLIKRINYMDDGQSINEECPFVIENERIEADFVFGTTKTKQICTDNKILWDGAVSTKDATYQPDDLVVLLYP